MTLTDYTSYEDVRAALGVTDIELEDSTLSLEVYSSGLEEDLYDVSANLVTTYKGVTAKADEDRTEKEARVYRLVRVFATYSAAKLLGTSLPMFGPRSVSDGKASMSRFSSDPYKDVLKRLSEQYDLSRGRLIRALDDLSSSTTDVTLQTVMLRVSSAYDPVTDAGA